MMEYIHQHYFVISGVLVLSRWEDRGSDLYFLFSLLISSLNFTHFFFKKKSKYGPSQFADVSVTFGLLLWNQNGNLPLFIVDLVWKGRGLEI